jgi:hypothetical protein
MTYDVTEVKPVPGTDTGIQDEIRDATSDGSKLVCIEIDPPRDRLLIITCKS